MVFHFCRCNKKTFVLLLFGMKITRSVVRKVFSCSLTAGFIWLIDQPADNRDRRSFYKV